MQRKWTHDLRWRTVKNHLEHALAQHVGVFLAVALCVGAFSSLDAERLHRLPSIRGYSGRRSVGVSEVIVNDRMGAGMTLHGRQSDFVPDVQAAFAGVDGESRGWAGGR